MKSHCKIASVGKHLATEEKVEKFYLRCRAVDDLRYRGLICGPNSVIEFAHASVIFLVSLVTIATIFWRYFNTQANDLKVFGNCLEFDKKIEPTLANYSYFGAIYHCFKWSTIEEIIFVVDSFSVILFKFQFDERASHFTSL